MKRFADRIILYSNSEYLNAKTLGGRNDKCVVLINDDTYSYRKECAKAEGDNQIPRDKTLQDSQYFKELYRAIQEGEPYVTYLNDLVRPNDGGEPCYPHKVSCLLKMYDTDSRDDSSIDRYMSDLDANYIHNEVIGSRIASVMGVDTVYNLPICSSQKGENEDDYPAYDRLISVDFMQSGYQYDTLDCLKLQFFPSIFWKLGMEELVSNLYQFGREHNIPNLDEQVKKVQRKIIDQVLFKDLISGDTDIYAKNFIIIWRDGVEMDVGPCFDYELGFPKDEACWVRMFKNNVNKRVFKYLSEEMPEILDSFMSKVNNLKYSGKLDKILEGAMRVSPDLYMPKLRFLHTKFDIMEESWANYCEGKKSATKEELGDNE